MPTSVTVPGASHKTDANFEELIRLVSQLAGGEVGLRDSGGIYTVDLSGNSPAAPSTAAGVSTTVIAPFRSMQVYAHLQGATGGTLDVYLQTSPDAGATWVDYAHFSQIAAAAAAIDRVWTVSKHGQQLTLQTVGVNLAPALAVNTIVGGDWGDRMRVLFVAGAGTTAGAAQTLKLILTT